MPIVFNYYYLFIFGERKTSFKNITNPLNGSLEGVIDQVYASVLGSRWPGLYLRVGIG